MKKQLVNILITIAVCLGILILFLDGFLYRARLVNEAHNAQQETSSETEVADVDLIIVTPTVSVTPTPAVTETPTPEATPEPTPELTADPTPEPVIVPTTAPTDEPVPPSDSNGHIVAIDAGHQRKGNSEKEPNGPGSTVMKAKVSSGTTGCATGVYEYVVNLDVSLLLKEELGSRGYQVVMIRETHDVNISNSERAKIANTSGAEAFIRVHCNGVDNSSVRGALTMSPTSSNPYVGYMASECERLSRVVIDEYCAVTGFQNKGIQYFDNMSGINWCEIPVTIIELGFMSNPEDDAMLVDPAMQVKMAEGIANGIDAYFGL